MDLALNNLQRLICHWTPVSQAIGEYLTYQANKYGLLNTVSYT